MLHFFPMRQFLSRKKKTHDTKSIIFADCKFVKKMIRLCDKPTRLACMESWHIYEAVNICDIQAAQWPSQPEKFRLE